MSRLGISSPDEFLVLQYTCVTFFMLFWRSRSLLQDCYEILYTLYAYIVWCCSEDKH